MLHSAKHNELDMHIILNIYLALKWRHARTMRVVSINNVLS